MSSLNEWIQPCLSPISEENPCGDFARYSDQFAAIKQEMEKLSQKRYDFLQQACFELLTQQSKDMTIATYYCVSLTQLYQADGLIAGLQLLTQLLTRYDQDLHPHKPRARLLVFKWLNQPKLWHELTTTVTLAPEQLYLIQSRVAVFNQTIKTHCGEGFFSLTCLNSWLLQQKKTVAPTIPKQEKKIKHPTEKKLSNENKLTMALVETDKQANWQQKSTIQFWQTQGEWPLACQLARIWRWHQLAAPTHAQGKTTLVPPRKEAQQGIESSYNQQQGKHLLALCELVFLEPSGAFWLDLQRYASEAAVNAGYYDLSVFIRQQTQTLVRSQPLLLDLTFNNDQRFANEQTRQWLFDEVHNSSELSVESLCNQLNDQTALSDALLKLEDLITSQDASHQVVAMQARARLCMRHKRTDMALLFYQQLDEHIEGTNMAYWFPDKGLQLKREILLFLQNTKRAFLEKAGLAHWEYQLRGRMAELSPAKACLFL